jgi:RNA polymerase sigma-54 factor
MTPQLQQAIRLLALSNLEIEGFIAEEIAKNPLLESGGQEEAPLQTAEPEETSDRVDDTQTLAQFVDGGGIAGDAPGADDDYDGAGSQRDADSASAFGSDGALGLSGTAGGGSGEALDVANLGEAEISLHDHLRSQAGTAFREQDLLVAIQVIEQIDETGYLTGALMDIAQRLGIPQAKVEQVLAIVQTFEPSGVGARSLSECLAIQAREANRYDPAMARLIENLDYLAKGNLGALKRICGVDDEDLADMIRELRGYDPKPGCRFDRTERIEAVIPDVFVVRRGSGWAIELNNATLPKLIVNRSYYHELTRGKQDKTCKAWLSECLVNANWLTKALDQRARTIIKVASEIVKRQEGFFREGVAQMKPLTLRTVAEAIGMHESTVSRVTSNKYLSCDRGLFELKYFFTSGIQSAEEGGEAVSAEAVKSQIKGLIAAEGPKDVLSDDQLVELLRKKGFDIARRTVAKYREGMGIGSSVQRRRQKSFGKHAA